MAAQREPSIVQRALAEVVGTFLLVFLGAGAGTLIAVNFAQDKSASGLLIVALAHGLALLIAVYTIGKISGAHVNPAVSIALASVGKLKWMDAIWYIVAQLVGATLGALGVLLVIGREAGLAAGVGATFFKASTNPVQAAAIEALGAFVLVLAIVGTAVDKRAPAGWAGLVIGLALAAPILFLGPITGASLNPARTFGPDIVMTLFTGKASVAAVAGSLWGQYWVYIVGPIVGGVAAAWLYRFIARPDESERVERPAAKPAAAKPATQPPVAAKAGAKRR